MNYLDEFIVELEYVYNYSKNTIDSYSRDILKFITYFEHKDILKIKSDDIRQYLRNEDRLKEKSLARKISSLRTFYNFLLKKDYISINPMDSIEGPKIGAYLPDVLSFEEVDKLISIKTIDNFTFRNRTIMELLYSSGLRISELISLKLENINISQSLIKVMGKGSKERIVPLNDIATNYLAKYIHEIRPLMLKNTQTDSLFLNNHGKCLTRQAVFKMIKKRCQEVNINKNISPHTLRHSFATHLLQNGADIRFIQELLGHEDVGTTEIYTHIVNEQLKHNYDDLNPRDN